MLKIPGTAAMLEISLSHICPVTLLSYTCRANSQAGFILRAQDRFNRARFNGQLRGLWKRLSGGSTRLMDLGGYLSDNSLNLKSSSYAGLQAVPIAQIRGSEGRAADFDDHFNPLNENTRDRWKIIMLACLQRVDLPPVELVRVGEVYFVRDGHHRISVAKSLGGQVVDARVTDWQVESRLPWEAPFTFGQKAGDQYGVCAAGG
jgi:hypothetical protein